MEKLSQHSLARDGVCGLSQKSPPAGPGRAQPSFPNGRITFFIVLISAARLASSSLRCCMLPSCFPDRASVFLQSTQKQILSELPSPSQSLQAWEEQRQQCSSLFFLSLACECFLPLQV